MGLAGSPAPGRGRTAGRPGGGGGGGVVNGEFGDWSFGSPPAT